MKKYVLFLSLFLTSSSVFSMNSEKSSIEELKEKLANNLISVKDKFNKNKLQAFISKFKESNLTSKQYCLNCLSQ